MGSPRDGDGYAPLPTSDDETIPKLTKRKVDADSGVAGLGLDKGDEGASVHSRDKSD